MPLTKLNSASVIERLPVGSVLQTVEAQSSAVITTPSTSFIDVNGTSITITPSSTSSKIFLIWNCGGMTTGLNNAIDFKVLRGSTDVRVISRYGYGNDSNFSPVPIAIQYLDSPATTSAVTYKLQSKTEGDYDFRICPVVGTDGMVVIAMEIKG